MKFVHSVHAQLVTSGTLNSGTTISFNNLIATHARRNAPRHVFSLYLLMLRFGFTPNQFTFPSLLKASSSLSSQHTFLIHTHVFKFLGLPTDAFVHSSLIDAYAKSGCLVDARQVFVETYTRDVVVWNSIIAGYSRTGESLEAFGLFREMQGSGVKANETTVVALLDACAQLGAICYGRWVHAYSKKKNIRLNDYVSTALINMYAKCGSVHNAEEVFDEMTSRDALTFNAMIGGFAMHGNGKRALDLFKRMEKDQVKPDDVTFIVVLSACAHAGLVAEGRRHFESIKEVHRIETKLEHYICMVDLLGRAGILEEAHRLIRKMPMKPDAILWKSFLASCRIHNNVELGQISIKHLLAMNPEESGNYVLLSNIYAACNRWDDVKSVRKLMKNRGIDKSPGCSVLELEGELHEFVIGDNTHPQSKEIYSMLEEIEVQLRLAGYIPLKRDVLFDIDTEEKEDALAYHSERLAIAFSLISSSASTSIRIVKTLRVCVDCHTATKLISHIYKREIIVRDRNRFHHFQGGSCSCNDYW